MLTSIVKLEFAVGAGVPAFVPDPVLVSSELQLVAIPARQAGNKTVAAPKPTLAKNSFLVIINYVLSYFMQLFTKKSPL
jgi:butyrate kinase